MHALHSSFYGWHDDRVREYCCPLLLTSPFWLGGGAAPFILGIVMQSCCVVVWGSIPIYLSFRAAWEESKEDREAIQNEAGFKPNMSFRVADDDEDNGESFPEPPAKIMHVHVNLGTDPSCSCGMDFECTDHGVLLTKVSWNMPFSRADLRAGDLITAMNGHDVTGSNMPKSSLWAAKLAQIKASTQPDTAGIFLMTVDFVREGGKGQNIDNETGDGTADNVACWQMPAGAENFGEVLRAAGDMIHIKGESKWIIGPQKLGEECSGCCPQEEKCCSIM